MRQRQRDYSQLQDQMAFLDKKFRQAAEDKVSLELRQCLLQRLFERDCDKKIQDNLQQIDLMIRELDYLKDQNLDQYE